MAPASGARGARRQAPRPVLLEAGGYGVIEAGEPQTCCHSTALHWQDRGGQPAASSPALLEASAGARYPAGDGPGTGSGATATGAAAAEAARGSRASTAGVIRP